MTLEECKKIMEENDGDLNLRGKNITSLPDGLKVVRNLNLRGTAITSLPDGLTVGGFLDLENCKRLTTLPDVLTVGGNLDLRGTAITSLPDGLTVGGNLYLRGTAIKSLPEDITVFDCIYHDRYIKQRRIQEETVYVPGKYLYCDGILTHISEEKKIGDYIFYKGKIPGKNVVYDGQYYAHCKTFSEGVEDISYKKAKERGADQYKSLKTDSIVSKEEAISMYRVITGACSAGTHQFISGLDDSLIKDSYSVQEIIDLTKGQYGSSQFKAFFER